MLVFRCLGFFCPYGVLYHVCISLGVRRGFEREGEGEEGRISTDWWDASWMLSLPSVLRIALLVPTSRVLAESPSILGDCLI
jgi:hypothetical protein